MLALLEQKPNVLSVLQTLATTHGARAPAYASDCPVFRGDFVYLPKTYVIRVFGSVDHLPFEFVQIAESYRVLTTLYQDWLTQLHSEFEHF